MVGFRDGAHGLGLFFCVFAIGCSAPPHSLEQAVAELDGSTLVPDLLPAQGIEGPDAYDFAQLWIGLRADNPTQRFEVVFRDSMHLRGTHGQPWYSTLELVGWGRGDEPGSLPQRLTGSAEIQGNQLRIERAGGFSEWYANGPSGLEHGVDVGERPAGGDVLSFWISVSGGVTPVLAADGQTVHLQRDGHTVLNYAGLVVYDDLGRVLPSWMEVQAGNIRLCVDDAGATYPIVVDPTLSTEALGFSAADIEPDDAFGFSIAVDGTTAIIGAENESERGANAGAAYVFTLDASRAWVQRTKLLPTDDTTEPSHDGLDYSRDSFGNAVAISGRRLVVGRVNADNDLQSSGSAYVFYDDGAGWRQEQRLYPARDRPSAGRRSARYGQSAAIDGLFAAFGSPSHQHRNSAGLAITGPSAGSVYPWRGTEGSTGAASWVQDPELLPTVDGAETSAASDHFGEAVALSGTTLVVGSPDDNDPTSGADAGAVYVYVFDRRWTLQAKLRADDAMVSAGFGRAVAIEGDTLLVGAPRAGPTGSAYLFERTGGVWTQQQRLRPCDAVREFGESVDLLGDRVIVGTPDDGSAYVYAHGPATWELIQKLEPTTSAVGVAGVTRVALVSDRVALVGSPRSNAEAGIVHHYDLVQPIGAECTMDAECAGAGCFASAPGHCVDGVCCAASSCGECNSCNVPGTLGTCAPDSALDGSACGEAESTECSDPDSCSVGRCLGNHEPAATACGDTGVACLVDDACDGSGSCVDGGFIAVDAFCGDATISDCTGRDTCDGAGTCQANDMASGALCGEVGVECVLDDTCDGAGSCVDHGLASADAACGDPTRGLCTDPDSCDGAGACLANDASAGIECSDVGSCRMQTCDGVGACADAGFLPEGTACGALGGSCVEDDVCDAAGACVSQGFSPAGTMCGDPSEAPCDRPDACDGLGFCDPSPQPMATPCPEGMCLTGECVSPDIAGGCGCLVAPATAPAWPGLSLLLGLLWLGRRSRS